MVISCFEQALKEVPRLFTLLDSNPSSPTYGCMDRKYWKYKNIDYRNARCQESALSFALLYSVEYEGNIWYKNESAKNASVACMLFWASSQNRDGSFSEYFPNEHSHVATAFSLYAVARAYSILKMSDEKILRVMKKSAEWLNKNDDTIVINHDAGAAAALHLVYEITGERKFEDHAKKKIEKVLKNQNAEGWFYEYGGADIGYQSFTIYYLSDYWKRTWDKNVFNALINAVDFFSYFIHPDLSIGGQYGSRETTYCIPAGFGILNDNIPLAGVILQAMESGLIKKKIVGPYSFDDLFLSDELYAFLDCAEDSKSKSSTTVLPKDAAPFTKHFKDCGLFVQKTQRHYVVFNLKKGGIGKVFAGDKKIYDDAGWIISGRGSVLSTNGPSEAEVSDDGAIKISGEFYRRAFKYQSPTTIIVSRVLNLLHLSGTFMVFLRKMLITGNRRSGKQFSRIITVTGNTVTIEDSFSETISKLSMDSNFSYLYTTGIGLYMNSEKFRIEVAAANRVRIELGDRVKVNTEFKNS